MLRATASALRLRCARQNAALSRAACSAPRSGNRAPSPSEAVELARAVLASGDRGPEAAAYFSAAAANVAQDLVAESWKSESQTRPRWLPPYFGPGFPAFEPLFLALSTLFYVSQSAKQCLPLEAGRVNGVCIVGPRGVGTTTVLSAAALASAAFFPAVQNVWIDGTKSGCHASLNNLLNALRRRPGGLGDTVAVFVDNAECLSLGSLCGLLEHANDKSPDVSRVCVIAAGNPLALSPVRDQPAHLSKLVQHVHLPPLHEKSQYFALRDRVALAAGDAALGQAQAPRKQVLAAVDTWHLHTGGRFGAIDNLLSAQQVIRAHPLGRQDLPAPGPAEYKLHEDPAAATASASCLQFLRHRREATRLTNPFHASRATASHHELACILKNWWRKRCKATGQTSEDIVASCDNPEAVDGILNHLIYRDVLRVATPVDSSCGDGHSNFDNPRFTFAYPFQAMSWAERNRGM